MPTALSESTSRVILRIACSYERSGLCRYQERTLVASWSKTMPKTVPVMRGANAGALRPHCALGMQRGSKWTLHVHVLAVFGGTHVLRAPVTCCSAL